MLYSLTSMYNCVEGFTVLNDKVLIGSASREEYLMVLMTQIMLYSLASIEV